MRTLRQTEYYGSRSETFTLWDLTDWHVGAKAFEEKLFKQHVKQIADDPNARWIGGGDYIDGICQVGDKRYKPETLAPWLLGYTDVMGMEVAYATDLIKPIVNKCWGLVKGNHDWDAERYYGRNVYWEIVLRIAQWANVPPETLSVGAQGFFVPTFRRGTVESNANSWRMTIYAHHGYGGGRMPGGHALTLGRVLGDYDCDLALMGHRHVLQIVPKHITVPSKNGARTRQRWGVFMPSYLGQYVDPMPNGAPIDTYPELFGLPSTPVGAFPIDIHPFERKLVMRVSSDVIGEGKAYKDVIELDATTYSERKLKEAA